MMAHSARRWLMLLAVIGLVLIVDQTAKSAVLARVPMGQTVTPIPALAPFFQITPSMNTGAAFGFLPQAGDGFLILAVVIVIAMFVFYPRTDARAWLTRLGIALVVGGALGNALDRLTRGGVVDFVHLEIPGVIANVSNLADHAIVIGVILMLVDSWFVQPRHEKSAHAETQGDHERPGAE